MVDGSHQELDDSVRQVEVGRDGVGGYGLGEVLEASDADGRTRRATSDSSSFSEVILARIGKYYVDTLLEQGVSAEGIADAFSEAAIGQPDLFPTRPDGAAVPMRRVERHIPDVQSTASFADLAHLETKESYTHQNLLSTGNDTVHLDGLSESFAKFAATISKNIHFTTRPFLRWETYTAILPFKFSPQWSFKCQPLVLCLLFWREQAQALFASLKSKMQVFTPLKKLGDVVSAALKPVIEAEGKLNNFLKQCDGLQALRLKGTFNLSPTAILTGEFFTLYIAQLPQTADQSFGVDGQVAWSQTRDQIKTCLGNWFGTSPSHETTPHWDDA